MCAKLRRCVSLYRFGAFLSALFLCFVLTVPALAADSVVSGSSEIRGYALVDGVSAAAIGNGSISSGASSFSLVSPAGSSSFQWQFLSSFSNSSSGWITDGDSYGIYFSGYYYSISSGAKQSVVPSASLFSVTGRRVSGARLTGTVSCTLFDPQSSYVSVSDGVSLSFRFNSLVGDPLTDAVLYNHGYQGSFSSGCWSFAPVSGTFGANDAGFKVTSFRAVTSASSAELDALEDMASNIAAQNQILSQFYGDIVAICNQIYQRLGDLQAAQEESNDLFSNVISLLNTTNGKLEAINMAMSTYFELLINQLKQEGVDTRTAIADAEARLEAYLKPMIDYFNELEEQTGESAATLPQHKTDIDGFDNQGYGIDSDGQAGVAALVPVLTSFSWIFQIIAIFIGVGVINLLVKKGLS